MRVFVTGASGFNDINPRSVAWEPQVGVDEGLDRTLAWLRAEGYLT